MPTVARIVSERVVGQDRAALKLDTNAANDKRSFDVVGCSDADVPVFEPRARRVGLFNQRPIDVAPFNPSRRFRTGDLRRVSCGFGSHLRGVS